MPELPTGTVTFLFTDIEGSVRLWEQAPETMRTALIRHDELIETLVDQHRGVVVRPRGEGDSRFAVFRSAVDGVAAAFEIQRALHAESWPTEMPLRVRLALNTGETDLRAGDYYGVAINRCARLRAVAHGGQLLISEVTAELVRDQLPLGASLLDLGEHRLRDLARPQHIFQLLHQDLPAEFPPLETVDSSVERAAGTFPFVPAYPFPVPDQLIGRRQELEVLEQAIERGRANSQLMFLGGPAGTGKSALMGAFARRAQQASFLCLAGGCYEQESSVPLGPFRDALLDFLLAQPAAWTRAHLGSTVGDLVEVMPELRYHLNLPAAPSSGRTLDQNRLFGAVHACLRSLAEHAPVLLCLEDLHAADAASLDLIHYLARQTRRLLLTLVCTFRSDEVVSGQPLARLLAAMTREGAAQLSLGPLNRDDTDGLIAALLQGPASVHLGQSLWSTTQGNPLFVEQLVLALGEEGQLEQRYGVWQRAETERRELPGVVREVIGRRLNHLSPRCRDTLAMAAVLGQTVEHDALLASLDRPDDEEMLDDLEEALAARVFQPMPVGYVFGHPLLREVLYWDLSAPRRVRLHSRAGMALERLAGSRAAERADELAHHFVRGGHSGSIRARALHYSLLAGRRAATLSAHREAFEHFSHACDVVKHDEERADLSSRVDALEGRGRAERNLARWRGCIASYRCILELSDEPVRRAQARDAIGRALLQIGDQSGAIEEFESGLAELDTGADGPKAAAARFDLLYDQAFPILLQGRPAAALRLGHQTLPVAERLGQPRLLCNAHSLVAIAHMRQGRAEQAEEHYERARAAAERLEDTMPLALVHENLGAHHYYFGEFAASRHHLELARTLLRDSASERRGILSFRLLALVSLAEGDLAGALEQAELAHQLAGDSGDRLVGECCDVLGAIHAARTDWEIAASFFERALGNYETVGNVRGVPDALIGLGMVHERRGDWSRADELYRQAVDVTGRMEHSPHVVAARRHLGRLLLHRGQREAAEQIELALTLAESMPRSLEYPPTLLAMAELRSRDDPDGALGYAERSLAAAPTTEHLIEARLCLTTLCLAAGRVDQSVTHAAEASRLAERLGTARALGLGELALGRAAMASGPDAIEHVKSAIHQFEAARTPYERALALLDYAQAIERDSAEVARARSLRIDARRVLRQLGSRPSAASRVVLSPVL